MAMVDADWSIDRATGNIRYIGGDHDFSGGTPSYATVIQFHRWLQAFADDEIYSGDDELDIIDLTPSDRSTNNIITLLNGYNIDDTAAEHLYDGSIIQDGGDTIYDGIVNFGNPEVQIQLLQDGTKVADDWWNSTFPAGAHDGSGDASVLTDSGESWTTDEWVGYTIYNTTDGSQGLITANDATTITAALYDGTDNDWDVSDAYVIGVPLNGDAGQGISHRFMIKTRANGVDIDRRRLIGTARRFGRTYGEFRINGTSRGNNVLALTDATDLNNTTAATTVETWTTITNTEGLRLIDISGDGTNEEYYSEWDRATFTINQFYERGKWLQRDGSSSTLNGIDGEDFRGLTHSVAYDTETGTPAAATNEQWVYGTYVNHGAVTGGPFTVGEAVHEDTATPTWKGRVLSVDGTDTSLIIDIEEGSVTISDTFTGQSSGAQATVSATPAGEEVQVAAGEIAIYALDDDGTSGNIYGQILKGTAPLNNTRIYDPGNHPAYYTTSAAAVERTVSTPFVGVSTGSALIGAYGLGMEAADTAAADTFFDLGNNPITPPNNVTFTVSGLTSGEDRLLVTNDNGATGIDFTQMAVATLLNGAAETVVDVGTGNIPSDTPASAGTTGGIRIERNDGAYTLHRYTSYDATRTQFTIPSHDFSTNNASATNNVFVSYIDKLASAASENFSCVYDSDRTLFIRVRDGGGSPVKTAETTGTLGTNGGSVTVNKIDDT
jgi:hypothetical protein